MILAGQWEPTPPRPGSLDDAMARGFDPDTVRADRYPGPPLDAEWQEALDASVAEVRRMRDEDRARPGGAV